MTMNRFSFLLGVAAATSFLVAGCGVKEYGFVPVSETSPLNEVAVNPPAGGEGALQKSESFETGMVTSSGKVDLLFVIDNSWSMEGKQNTLNLSFNNFINQFVNKGIDFHVGVITSTTESSSGNSFWNNTDSNANSKGLLKKLNKSVYQSDLSGICSSSGGNWLCDPYQSPQEACLLSRVSGERFLQFDPVGNSSTQDLVKKFQANAATGCGGSPYEKGMKSVAMTLANGNAACNSGFFRDDALLSVILLSDENETITEGDSSSSSNTSKKRMDERVDLFVNTLKQFKAGKDSTFRADFIVHSAAANPNGGGTYTYPGTENGRDYPEIQRAAHNKLLSDGYASSLINIDGDFSGSLMSIGGEISDQAQYKSFTLSRVPIQSSVKVKVNGSLLASSGFTVEGTKVSLKGTVPANAIVNIDYEYYP